MKICYIQQVPNDLMYVIFSFLNRKTLFGCPFVCKNWKEMLREEFFEQHFQRFFGTFRSSNSFISWKIHYYNVSGAYEAFLKYQPPLEIVLWTIRERYFNASVRLLKDSTMILNDNYLKRFIRTCSSIPGSHKLLKLLISKGALDLQVIQDIMFSGDMENIELVLNYSKIADICLSSPTSDFFLLCQDIARLSNIEIMERFIIIVRKHPSFNLQRFYSSSFEHSKSIEIALYLAYKPGITLKLFDIIRLASKFDFSILDLVFDGIDLSYVSGPNTFYPSFYFDFEKQILYLIQKGFTFNKVSRFLDGAVKNGTINTVNALLKTGKYNPLEGDSKYLRMSLQRTSTSFNYFEMIELLIDISDKYTNPPQGEKWLLELAIDSLNPKVVQLLLKEGEKLEPFNIIAKHNWNDDRYRVENLTILRILLLKGYDPNLLLEEDRLTPLANLIKLSVLNPKSLDYQKIHLLIEAGAEIKGISHDELFLSVVSPGTEFLLGLLLNKGLLKLKSSDDLEVVLPIGYWKDTANEEEKKKMTTILNLRNKCNHQFRKGPPKLL